MIRGVIDTNVVSRAYTVRLADETVEEQREAFVRLRRQLGSASPEENRRALEELREAGPPDAELTPELAERYQRLRASRQEGKVRVRSGAHRP